ncbi:MAG: NlpC/P60 family protein [Syntrophotaleaceae bacterium]
MRKVLFWFWLPCLLATLACAEPGTPAAEPFYALQTAAFARQSAAESAVVRWQGQGVAAYVAVNQGGLFVVRLGPYSCRAEALGEAARLQAAGSVQDCLVVQTRAPQEAPPLTVASAAIEQAAPAGVPSAASAPPPPVDAVNEAAAELDRTVGSRMADTLEMVASHSVSPQSFGLRVARIALDFLGVPYRWGGMSRESGMDCSGFVKTVYALCGITLPRTSAEQYRQGQPVKRDELAAGDLVFFGRNQRVNHVGIYLGDGQYIHAPRTKETIRIASLEGGSALRRFLGARRIWFDH